MWQAEIKKKFANYPVDNKVIDNKGHVYLFSS